MTLRFFFLLEIRTIGCCTASSPPSKAPKRHQTASSTAWRVECAHRGIFRIDRIAEYLSDDVPFPIARSLGKCARLHGSWFMVITSCSSVSVSHMPVPMQLAASALESYTSHVLNVCYGLFSSQYNLMSTIVATNFDLHQRRRLAVRLPTSLNKHIRSHLFRYRSQDERRLHFDDVNGNLLVMKLLRGNRRVSSSGARIPYTLARQAPNHFDDTLFRTEFSQLSHASHETVRPTASTYFAIRAFRCYCLRHRVASAVI